MENKFVPQTLVEMFFSIKHNHDTGINFILSGNTTSFLSYQSLHDNALVWLGYLQANGVQAGHEIVFQLDDNKTFIQLFWACILGGIIPVPLTLSFHGENARKLSNIQPYLKHPYLFTNQANYEKLRKLEHDNAEINGKYFDKILFFEDMPVAGIKGSVKEATPDTIAFIQFSSGSTGDPKGVTLTHRNLITNIRAAADAHKSSRQDCYLSWMPLTHDMGLIGFHLYPMIVGAVQCLMPADLFIRNPLLWMQKASEHKATIICSPNFGYKYFLNHFTAEKGKDWDLSSVRIILNGAEPVSATICRDFMQSLENSGLHPHAMCAGYGLAEATLEVTFPGVHVPFSSIFIPRKALVTGQRVIKDDPENTGDTADSMEVVNLGMPISGVSIKIANKNGQSLESGRLGIIWIKGDAVTKGYYNNTVATAAVIRQDGWLNTGDTGFIWKDCLYVTGRVKDIIFVNGVNVFPHDIEEMLEKIEGIEGKAAGKVAACGVPDEKTGSECVVVFVVHKSSVTSFLPVIAAVKKYAAINMGLEIKQVIPVKKIPKTTSGKVKRYLLAAEYQNGVYEGMIQQITEVTGYPVDENSTLRDWLRQWLQNRTGTTKEELDQDKTFAGYGVTSMLAVALAADLQTWLQVVVDNTVIYNFPTIPALTKHLSGIVVTPGIKNEHPHYYNDSSDNRIAIIGMGCRFPGGVSNPGHFWDLLMEERSGVSVIPKDRWGPDAQFDRDTDAPDNVYIRQAGVITDVDQFDPLFFGISPKEAAGMDPQQRLLLEVSWEALEHAGIRPSKLRGSDSGVFIGMGTDDYAQIIRKNMSAEYFEDAFSTLGLERSIAAGRIAYVLDFHGPVMQLDTACSSSLLSVHQACQSLLHKECSLALAGGVNLMLSPEATIKLHRMKALSSSGFCKTFDDSADGYVRGEGCGIVVLKRLRDALADGDNILAVIRGSAVNHDGLSNGLTAPNGSAQQQLLEKALKYAGVSPDAIQYIETHGTGTRLGDPVEVQALNNVYGSSRPASQPLMIGAVKTNIGHLEAAAGIAGLIKTVLCLQHKKIPANLHFHTPNKFIPWKDMTLKVVDRLTPWEPVSGKRCAGVSAFGLSGTNVHMILEEAAGTTDKIEVNKQLPAYPSYPILLSAKTSEALQQLADNYIALLENTTASLPDISGSTVFTREIFKHRLAFEAASVQEARKYLQTFLTGAEQKGMQYGVSGEQQGKLVWLFTGGGAQYWNMGKELYENNVIFKEVIDRCSIFLEKCWGFSLTALLYEKEKEEASRLLLQMTYFQPAIYAVSCALAEVWKSWNIFPSIVAGHSVGEYAAAYTAGVFSLEDGLKIVTERARLMQAVKEPGGMATVFASEEVVAAAIAPYGKSLSVAAINAPGQTVISGQKKAVNTVLQSLSLSGIDAKELLIAHASHSPLMEPILQEFREVADSVRYNPPALHLISNVTGKPLSGEVDWPTYWCDQIVQPVQFFKSMQAIKQMGGALLMELGPQPNLLSIIQATSLYDEGDLIPNMRFGRSSWSTMLESIMLLYIKGIQINWNSFYDMYSYRKVPLPTYPFTRQRYWITADETMQPYMKINNTPPDLTNGITVNGEDRTEILGALAAIFGSLLKIPPTEINIHQRFLELGADSLVLTNAVRRIEKRYALNFTIKQLFEDINTLDRMADYIAKQRVHVSDIKVPAALKAPREEPAASVVRETGTIASVADYSSIVQRQLDIIEQQGRYQYDLMSQQLQLLSKGQVIKRVPDQPLSGGNADISPVTLNKQPLQEPQSNGTPVLRKNHKTIFPKIDTRSGQTDFTAAQQEYLDAFISRYNLKTKTSKALTQQYRPVLADNRVAMGFRFSTKEMHYPIQVASSFGSKVTDVDGNEYIDLAMGFGVNLLGHRPEVVVSAVQRQLHTGFQLGPMSPLTGEVASRIAALTGMDRVSFHNSGTEAVMTAVRIARAVTKRKKIAIFIGAYHGHFDGTLATIEDIEADHRSIPLTSGVLENMVADVLIFDYTHPQVVEQIRAFAPELAAVVVEPVQSRNPGYQPVAMLKELRAMTASENIVMIFDEMITGFRIHPGGAQAYFGIKADLVTYGKIAGGGLPIGIVAGKRQYMDALDGGNWQYGDGSYPKVETTYFAGTFCKHPLSMAAALALLTELAERGPALQEQLNIRTARLVNDIADFFLKNNVPMEVHHFGSLFHFSSTVNMDIFFYHLLEKGVYIWEGRTCFLSVAHTDEDIDFMLSAVKNSIRDLQHAGFLATQSDDKTTTTTGFRIPLSFSQESLWLIDQLEGSVHYHVPAVLKLKGKLDHNALTFALKEIVHRHEALRTVIRQSDEQDNSACQHVLDAGQWELPVTGQEAFKDNPAALQEYVLAFSQIPFDLSRDYMLKSRLLKLSPDEHILILVFHHIAFDDWSSHIFFRELTELYSARLENRPHRLLPVGMSYTDYAIQQRSFFTGALRDKHLTYWKHQLQGAVSLNLPADYPLPANKSREGKLISFHIDRSLTVQLRQLSQQQGTTLYMTLLAVFKVLLYRLSGQEDICVGSPVSGRSKEAVEDMIGFFVNTVVLRSNLSNHPSFATFLQQVKTTALTAYEYEEAPFEKVVSEVITDRTPDHHPLFQVMFVWQHTPDMSELHLGEATLSLEKTKRNTSLFDITLLIEEGPDDLYGEIEYSTDLYSAETISRWISLLKQLLYTVVKSPEIPIHSLSILTEEEEKQLLESFNNGAVNYPADKTIIDLFREQAARTPDATALDFEGGLMTYKTLDDRSDQLAQYLCSKGVKAEMLIPVCLQRSPEMIVGILGILKAGGAYVPIDPDYPSARIRYILEDTSAAFVLSSNSCRHCFTALTQQIDVIYLDDDTDIIGSFPGIAPDIVVAPEQLAYIIYTSGSTGSPKGVMIEHRNVVRLFETEMPYYDFNDRDVWTLFHSFCFDFSVWEMYGALFYGGRLVIVPKHIAQDATLFGKLLVAKSVTILNQTPSAFYVLQDYLTAHIRSVPVRYVIFGGEALDPGKLQPWLDNYPDCKLVNMYGITETTVHVTYQPINAGQQNARSIIGRAIPTLSIYVLDPYRNLVPVGVTGELYVSGAGLSRGYLHRPDLTAERFVHNPFTSGAGEKMYRTGDLGRWLPDGNIEYLGRIDDQVKIRGHRIELGEVTQVLRQCELVSQAFVLTATPGEQSESNHSYLVGYVVPVGTFDRERIMSYLIERLPEYMVPVSLVALDKLPLTANGKIDKKQLPDPNTGLLSANIYVAPRNEAEQMLAILWAQLLGVEKVGIRDNFFELGGDSIVAIQVVSRLRKAGYELRPGSLFKYQTIEKLSFLLSPEEEAPVEIHNNITLSSANFLPPDCYGLEEELNDNRLHDFLTGVYERKAAHGRITSMYPLSGLQEGMLFHAVYDLQTADYINQFSCEFEQLQINIFEECWHYLLQRHSILRSGFYPDSFNVPVQCVHSNVPLELPVADFSHMEKDVQQQALAAYEAADRIKGFDLTNPPLMRLSLIHLDKGRYRFLWTHHHIILDGWSLVVLVEELQYIYRMLVSGQKPLWGDEDLYEDYIRYIGQQDKEKAALYWREYLGDITEGTLLPFIENTAERTKGGGTYKEEFLEMDEAVTKKISHYARSRHITVNTLMQGIWCYLLYRYTGNQSVTFGVTVSGRPETLSGMEERVGLFINGLPLHTRLDELATITEWLQTLQGNQLQSREYQYNPLYMIRQWLGISGDIFDSVMVFENFPFGNALSPDHRLRLDEIRVFEQNNYPLSIIITEEKALRISFCYNIKLLEQSTVQMMAGHFEQVLLQIVNNQVKSFKELELLTTTERKQLLETFNNTTVNEPAQQYKTLIDLLENQALCTPEATALVYDECTLSYEALVKRVNQFAHYLRGQGVTTETLVPVCMERSINMIVSILAIMKAGGAYVPIDPDFPAERIGHIIEDCKATLLLTSSMYRQKLPAMENIRIIEPEEETISEQILPSLIPAVIPSQLAYVIYTSGSTGRPKGVMIEHRGMLNHLQAKVKTLHINQTSVVAFTAACTFDISVWQMFAALIGGGKTVIYKEDLIFHPAALMESVSRDKITILELVPSYLASLLQEFSGAITFSLQYLLVTGEAVSKQLLKQWFSHRIFGTIPVVNAYGPTEASDDICHYVMHETPVYANVPVGTPIQNLKVYILGPSLQLCPVGVKGEIYVSGIGVARGYLQHAALTAEKFVTDPFSADKSVRMYCTGDLGKWLPDGNIEYLGRIDDQVKIRGYRVELGEIERVLQESGLISEVAVIAWSAADNDQRLAAYIVPAGAFDRESIIAYLRQRLPVYMIPDDWIVLDKLPLTANGKINRNILPAPETVVLPANAYVAPRNTTEEILGSLWQQLLGVQRIGIHDNFFRLGGHSLKAIRLMAGIRTTLHKEVSIKSLFQFPTISGLAAQLLSSGGNKALPALEVMPRPDFIPLSYSQERLWFIHQMEGSVQYHLPAVLRLKGKLNKDALAFALQAVINRHEVLRTVIRQSAEKDMAWQCVEDKDQWQLTIIDDATCKTDPEALQHYIKALIDIPFDLTADHMLRAHLMVIGEEEHVLVITLHHIAFDDWSAGIIIRELVEFYDAFTKERSPVLAPLNLQYADYAIWQRKYLSKSLLEHKINYWKEKLSGVPVLKLPTDYVRPVLQKSNGAGYSFYLDKTLTHQLKELYLQQGTTLFMTLLAAFKVLLYRYTGQTDICVGCSTGARLQEAEALIGFFVNTLALRSDLSDNPSFLTFLHQVKEVSLSAYEHQEVPFEMVVEAVVNEREISRNPLFQVLFVMHNVPEIPEIRLGDIVLSGEIFDHTASRFDMSFSVVEEADRLQISVAYRNDLFSATTIERMAGHFVQLLQSIVRNPEQQVGTLSMLTDVEEKQLLTDFSQSIATYPEGKTVVDLFESQAASSPDAVALVFESCSLTYRELNRQADCLAAYLFKQGVKAGTLVPICVERSVHMITAILGILKAGAVYVPIDADYPADRINYILSDTAAAVIISSDACRHQLPVTLDIICLDRDNEKIRKETQLLPVQAPAPDQTAYIIYTSGSTGTPKGVMVTHRNLVDYFFGLKEKVPVEDCRSFALLSSIATDLGNTVVYSALLTGASLHLFSLTTVSDGNLLLDYFSRQSIDCIKIVPSHWKALSASGRLLLPEKLLIFGGEALDTAVADSIRLSGAACMIVNHYGPTETTIGKLLHIVNEHTVYHYNIPIGKPFSNTRIYVLSPYNQLCPVGIPGELYVGGDGVALGYYNNEVLTESRFIADPYLITGETRFYRTGDRVKYLPDGNIVFIGRMDEQVKIRGYRVEPGETERVLNACTGVKQAVVTVSNNADQLIGYIIPAGVFDKNAILFYLKERLPEYMIPSVLVEVKVFPLLANGKIDKHALPDPGTTALSGETYVAARNETELILVNNWQQLLNVGKVGIHDNFFELGGHSLLAMRLTFFLRKAFQTEVSVKNLFLYPTIAGLAAFIEEQQKGTAVPVINIMPRPERIPLSYSQERLWFIDRLEGSVQYHISAVLKLKGKLNTACLHNALKALVNRHEVLRTVIAHEDGIPYQRILDKDSWQLTVTDAPLYRKDTLVLQSYINQLMAAPFDLTEDHPLRAYLVVLGEEEYLLELTLHHIACDGWSADIILKELAALYNAYVDNTDIILPSLPIQYADYAIWQRADLSGTTLDNKLEYWRGKLKGVATLQLPTDYPRPGIQSTRGAKSAFRLDLELLNKLRQLSNQQGTTLFMTLLTVFKILLYRYSGQDDICVGSPIAGRIYQEVTELIGFFVNTLALRSDVKEGLSFISLLRQVKQTTLDAYDHQEVPFEKIVEAIVRSRDLSRNPVFQMMFELRNTPQVVAPALKDVEVSAIDIEQQTTQFDLTVTMQEEANGLYGEMVYCVDLFHAKTIDRMMRHYEQLLKAVVATPGAQVKALSMLTPEEEHQLLVTFNDTATDNDHIAGKTFLHLFSEQVALTPDAVAVVFEKETLSYRELNEHAEQLASYLISKNIAPETFVPVCIERSPLLIIAILGIMKSGAAYVPIDMGLPAKRISYLLEDCNAGLIISSSYGKQQLPLHGYEIVLMDADWEIIARQPAVSLETRTTPNSLAYLIYTSGSTGQPKGVMIEHRGMLNHLLAKMNDLKINQDTILACTAAYTFDISVWQLFAALLCGGRTVIYADDLIAYPSGLIRAIDDDKITILELVPSYLDVLLQEKTSVTFKSVQYLLVTGEPVSKHLLEKWFKHKNFGSIPVVNAYGPTEASDDICHYFMYGIPDATNVPVGKALQNLKIYILNDALQLCPVGITGEICVAGTGVARGYLNRAELNAEKFIRDPFNTVEDIRMFRTGDIGCWLPDGNIVFMGRKDDQVKLNGFRIEPGEIEYVMQQCELIKQAVVLIKTIPQDDMGNSTRQQLVGYIVPEGNFSRAQILFYLKERLPEYMIPSQLIELDRIPLTINGKIDKQQLLELFTPVSLTDTYTPPRSETEHMLVSIWQKLLGIQQVGICDNFFELGGHSLLAMRLVSELYELFQVEVPVSAVFQLNNIESLARYMEVRKDDFMSVDKDAFEL
ncbi:amino acid adenylation domain-containing protein [Chitinophaga niastensis]|uniref:Amino acid adenylation domain-containing protein n=1 Tax=Chitinophaga niastensis TaxID=536980 RepID=A0A2P8HFI0_CHINA|nr:hybrid non-ribosomal peptide synthetase/type I polyketide synthase [Chitinophaga niastensis]PSL44992.1 amino acid adenylation domain-containing protein [Chitinophaga niastensis]